MDGATLTIKLQDESPTGGSSPATTPQQGGTAPPTFVYDQQKAITDAGGVGAFNAKNQTTQSTPTVQPPVATTAQVPVTPPVPVPTTTSSSSLSLDQAQALFLQQLKAAAPNATPEELAKAMGGGFTSKKVKELLEGPTTYTSPTPASAPASTTIPTPKSTADDIVANTRKMWDDNLAASTKEVWDNEKQEQAAKTRTASSVAQKPTDPSLPKPPPLSVLQQIEEAERKAPPLPKGTTDKVKDSIEAISGLARMGGPLGGALGTFAKDIASLPGAANALGTALPALVTAAPAIVATTVGVGVAGAVAASVQATQSQIANQIQGLSPDVAVASSQAEIRQLLNNIKTASNLGGEVARGIKVDSVINEQYRNVRDTVAAPSMDAWTNIKTILSGLAEGLNYNYQAILGSKQELDASRQRLKEIETLLSKQQQVGFDNYKPMQGLLGAIPHRPSLPPPFVTENRVERDRQSVRITGAMENRSAF